MKSKIRKIVAISKNIIIWFRPGVLLGFLHYPLLFLANLLQMTRWISKHAKRKDIYNDFFVWGRDHSRRYNLFKYVTDKEGLSDSPIIYLEFGVFGGHSFTWWTNNNNNSNTRFFGFDTFEGLPEHWGTYNKGEMSSTMPLIDDERVEFIKGLFQETLYDFLLKNSLQNKKLVIHLDADLFSSTLFVLTNIAKYLKKDDIIFFDEFNVPNHEWMAYKLFIESFYLDLELIGSVNNFYQVAFKVNK